MGISGVSEIQKEGCQVQSSHGESLECLSKARKLLKLTQSELRGRIEGDST